uniref:TLC domain-containing protein n=3 Tax=Opuntia streptacantha TaxID=393608 RepID=A0A7C9DIM0_OPUST
MLDFDFNSLAFPVSLPLSFSTSHVFCVLLCKSKKMEDYVVNTIIGAVIFWTTLLFMIRKMLPDRSYEFCNRLVSTTHATLGVTLAALSVQDWSSPVSPLASNSTPKQMKTLAISVGYFIYDLICSQFDKKSSVDNSVHHLVCIVGLAAGLAYQKCGSEMVAALFITEMSTPFLHFREFLKELGYRDAPLNLAADIMFALIFSVARMIGGPYLTYVTLSADNPLLIKAMASGLQLVSIFWFYKILRMVKYKLIAKPTSMKKIA